MELSPFLAKLFGVSSALFAIVGLVRPKLIKEAVDDFNQSAFMTIIIGYMMLVASLAIVLAHNVWDGSWRVIITLFGWAGLLKSMTYLLAPESLGKVGTSVYASEKQIRMVLVLFFLLGVYLAAKGFGF